MNANVATQLIPVDYQLRFCKNSNDVKVVNFVVKLNVCDIDSLTFLFSKYFDQHKHVAVKGLTFFNEFNKCVESVKRDFDRRQQNSDIKQIFTQFLNHEFMGQVPQFKKIIHYLQIYLKPVSAPSVKQVSENCDQCPVNEIKCLQCKVRYLGVAITAFDAGIQEGWDIFLRPMFGLPLFLFVLFRTEYDREGIFNADDLITNSFACFFKNMLTDTSSRFVDFRTTQPLINECRRAVVGFSHQNLEFLLCMLRKNHSCEGPLFAPFRKFIVNLACSTKIKQSKINKIASVVFSGFFLRLYLEGSASKFVNAAGTHPFGDSNNCLTPFEMEIRNVCHFIMPNYDDAQFERFIGKLAAIRNDLCIEQYLVTEKHIRRLISAHNLDEDLSVLLNQNV